MSNPAVIKLQSGRIEKSRFWMDDNFGESIHIHIDDHRVDLTVKEFEQLYTDLCIAMNELFHIEGLDFSDIDPVFLESFLWRILPTITHVKYDKVFLEDLWAPFGDKYPKLKDSVGVMALKGLSNENEGYRKSHHIGQTDAQRLKESYDSIKENGYPYQNKYIILYGDTNVIYDGQHRASCLYCLYGNIEVPVLRIYSSEFDGIDPKKHKLANCVFIKAIRKVANIFSKLFAALIKKTSLVLRIIIGRAIRFIKRRHKVKSNDDLLSIFDAR